MTAINYPFESDLLRQARRQRQGERGPASRFLGEGDDPTPVRGDGYAPYVHAIGRAAPDGLADGVIPEVGLGDPQRLLTDALGRLWTREALPGDVVGAASRYTTGGTAEAQRIVKASAGRVFQASMALLSTGGGDRVLMLFNQASAVTNGAVPIWRGVLPDPGSGNFGQVALGFAEVDGLAFDAGLVVACSSTVDDLTLVTPAESFFQVTYR